VEPLDVCAAFHFGERGAQHRRDMKYVRNAVAFEHDGKTLRARHFAIVSKQHSPTLMINFSGLVRNAAHSFAI
jgi:hypothetical protein